MRFKRKNKSQWHRWFAWYPVYVWIGDQYVWLEYVERKYYGILPDYRLLGENE